MISIIVPVYNAEKYLNRCVDSILSQTYTDIELILINDGSTDSSGELCKKYAENDSRVKYFSKENEGISVTRFKAMDHVNGEYFSFVDSDDYLSNDCIEILLNAMTDEVDCVVAQHKRFGETEGVKQVVFPKGTVSFESDGKIRYYREVLNGIHGVEVWNKLFRTKIAKEVWDIPVNVKFGGDIFCSILYLNRCRAIRCLENTTYFYEYRQGSVARSSVKKMILPDYVEATKRVEPKLSKDEFGKRMFPLLAGHLYSIAMVKYAYGDDKNKTKTKEDLKALSSDPVLRKYADRFYSNRNYYKKLNILPKNEFELILGLYQSIRHGDPWYYTRLYPARIEKNKLILIKTYINKFIGRVKV